MGYKDVVGGKKGEKNKERKMIEKEIKKKQVEIIIDKENEEGQVGEVKREIEENIKVLIINDEINKEGIEKEKIV